MPNMRKQLKKKIPDIENKNTISGIPVSHIIMFGVGIILAIGILVALYITGKNKPIVQDAEDEDDF